MISVVDGADKIAEAVAAVEAMMGDGLIVISGAGVLRLVSSATPPEDDHA